MKKYKNKMGKFFIVSIMALSLIGVPISALAEEGGTDPTPSATPTPTPSESPNPTSTPTPTPSADPVKITLDKTTLELTVGETGTIKATVTGTDNTDVWWESTDSKIATVDQTGKVKAIAKGEANIKVKSNANGNVVTCKIVVKEKPEETQKPIESKKSNDTTIKSLSVTNGTLNPAFSSNIREYTIKISTDKTAKFTNVVKNHEKQNIKLPNLSNLKNGSIVNISVVAEDGTQGQYKFTIEKEGSESLDLKSLKVKGYTLNEPFSASKTGYTVDIPYEAEDVVIEVEKVSGNVSTVVKGATNLRVGSNQVTVTVKDNDGNTKVYTITVTRAAKEDEKENGSEKDNNQVTSHKTSSSTTQKIESTRKNHTVEYILVTIGCLILFAIGALGIFFYVKTSTKEKKEKKNKGKKATKNKKSIEDTEEETESTPMIEVKPENEEELEKTIEFTEIAKEKENNKKEKTQETAKKTESPKTQNVLKEIEDLFDNE